MDTSHNSVQNISSSHFLPISFKIKIYKTVILLAVLCGSETGSTIVLSTKGAVE
jgi:hypothetical protein